MAAPLINGVAYNWASIKFVLFGVPVSGILSIEYNRKQAKTNNYGAGKDPISRGYGRVENSASIEIYLDDWKRIIAAAPSRDPLLIPHFDIVVTFGDTVANAAADTLLAVEFLEDPFSAKEGDTKLTVKLPLIVGSIQR